MKPLVSILIPAYNAAPWLAETIESALKQTWLHREIIIVDDGSQDQTLAVANRFASRSVQVFRQENQGAASARNRAYSLCQGEYIQWLDADDLLAPDKINLQIQALGRYPSSRTLFSSSFGLFTYRPHKARFVPSALWCDLQAEEWLLRRWEQNLYMQPATWLVSRELTEAAGPWDTRLSLDDDGEYFTRVVMASDGIRFVREGRVYYRRGFESLSQTGRSSRKLESQLIATRLQVDHLRKLADTQRVRAACLMFLQQWLVIFYPERVDLVRQLQSLAEELGGRLNPPRLPAKYRWIQKLFGWTAAKEVNFRYNILKARILRAWDQMLYCLESRDLR